MKLFLLSLLLGALPELVIYDENGVAVLACDEVGITHRPPQVPTLICGAPRLPAVVFGDGFE